METSKASEFHIHDARQGLADVSEVQNHEVQKTGVTTVSNKVINISYDAPEKVTFCFTSQGSAFTTLYDGVG